MTNIIQITEEGITIEIIRNQLYSIVLYVYDNDGNPADLTDFKVWFYIFDDHSINEEEAVITKRNLEAGGNPFEISVDDLNGEVSVLIAPSDTINLNGNQFYYTLKIEQSIAPDLGICYPYKLESLIVTDDSIYEYEGWNIDKKQIAYYSLGSESLFAQVPDFICENAYTLFCTELNKYKSNLCKSVPVNDPTLLMAIHYFAACEIKGSGNSSQSSGNITRESIGDKSVSYSNIKEVNVSKVKIPQDVCEKAVWLIKQYVIDNKLANKDIVYAISNYRSKVFDGIYNKHTDNYKYGVPE